MTGDGSSSSLSIFLSYSRQNRDVSERIAEALKDRGFIVSRDLDDILPTEAWKERLQSLIETTDAVVFLLSPASALSEVCQWEVELASSLGKRIAPVVIEDVEGRDIPPLLSRLNYIFATEADRLDNAVRSLADAFSGDAEWVREHTRLLALALNWERGGGRPSLLLTAADGLAVTEWLARKPDGTPGASPQLMSYVEASAKRADASRRYAEARLRVMDTTIHPLIEQAIKKLTEDYHRTNSGVPGWTAPTVAGTDKLEEIANYRNLLPTGGRWHPSPAAVGAIHPDSRHPGTTVTRFVFPCCNLAIESDSARVPEQYRDDGCGLPPDVDFPSLQREIKDGSEKLLPSSRDFKPDQIIIISDTSPCIRWVWKDFRREAGTGTLPADRLFYVAFRCGNDEPPGPGKKFFSYYHGGEYERVPELHRIIGPETKTNKVRKDCVWYYSLAPQRIAALCPELFEDFRNANEEVRAEDKPERFVRSGRSGLGAVFAWFKH